MFVGIFGVITSKKTNFVMLFFQFTFLLAALIIIIAIGFMFAMKISFYYSLGEYEWAYFTTDSIVTGAFCFYLIIGMIFVIKIAKSKRKKGTA